MDLSSVSGAQTLPTDWGLSSNDLTTAPTSVFPASDDPDFPAALEGNYMQIDGRPDKVEYVGFGQELDIQGKKNDVWVCGGWASAHSVPNATEPERSFAIIPSSRRARTTPWTTRTTPSPARRP